MQIDTDQFELPDLIIPTARPHEPNGHTSLSEGSHGLPLLNSRWPFTEQCRALINSKSYGIGDE